MESSQKPSIFVRFGGFLLFVSLSLGALVWFGWSLFQMITQIASNSPIILFDKGALYMLGVGIGLSVLTYVALHEVILKRPLTKKMSKKINMSALVSLITLIIFPQIVHYPVERFLENRNYKICEQASYQWLLYRKIVYASSFEVCTDMIEKNK